MSTTIKKCSGCGKEYSAALKKCPNCEKNLSGVRLKSNRIGILIALCIAAVMGIGKLYSMREQTPGVVTGEKNESALPPRVITEQPPDPAPSPPPVVFTTPPITFLRGRGEIQINRVWSAYNYAYALLSYHNTSGRSFKRLVRFECVALDAWENKINVNDNAFYASRIGPIYPGFKREIKVMVGIEGKMQTFQGMRCRISEAR